MFNIAEKVVLTFSSLTLVLLIASLGLRIAGLEAEGVTVGVAGFVTFAAAVFFGSVAFLKYIWFDA